MLNITDTERYMASEIKHMAAEIQRLSNEATAWAATCDNLTMENTALLKANIDCVNNFDALKEDFDLVTYEGDALRAEVASLKQLDSQRLDSLRAIEDKLDDQITISENWKSKAERLKEKIAALEAQEPVAKIISWSNSSYSRNYKIDWIKNANDGDKLYLAAGAAPACTSDEWLANCPQSVRDLANKIKAGAAPEQRNVTNAEDGILRRAAMRSGKVIAEGAAPAPPPMMVSTAPSYEFANGWNSCRAKMLEAAPKDMT